ncbi:MAG TPA: MFS transporter [Tepidisphaeraceae bacterium]|jgi:hypothetical protein|nr:MFS transporter [Tepidisphaeraceae bacterium]
MEESLRPLDNASPPLPDQQGSTRQTFLYFASLTLFIYLATPAGLLVDIQTTYLLKNQLHATPTQISIFRLVTAIPVYFAFVAGLIRDQWSPLGLRDRGYFLLFAPATAIVFLLVGCTQLSFRGMLIGMFAAMLLSRFFLAAFQGLIALIGQEKLMSGRLTAVWNIVMAFPAIAGAFGSGYISDHLNPRATFFIVAAFAFCIAAIGLVRPRAVFSHAYDAPQARTTNFVQDIMRLVRHRAIYPAVLINFMWNFAPGMATPLQFYLSDVLHASDAIFSYFNGIFTAAFIPTFLLYGFLCKRVPLRKLLFWGTLVAVPQLVPFAFIHSARLALVLAAPIGLMGGIAAAAYIDLAMRSCPPGLQGTLMMMVDGVLALSSRGGDLLGSAIYNGSPKYGFIYCVIVTTAVYLLILPLILLVPRKLIDTTDGQPQEETAEPPGLPVITSS